MWDDEVDVVCCGSGFGALAAAIAAADAGLDVHIARPGIPSDPQSVAPGPEAPWLGAGIEDSETREYFEALSADLERRADAEYDAEPMVRAVSEWTPVSGRGRIAPFYGARLQDWAQCCLTSPYGVLYTRLTDRGMTPMKARSGEEIQVKVLGVLEADGAAGTASVLGDWLSAQVLDRQIPTSDNSTLQRIVFEEGEVLGVVIDTADGPLALRARHGVAVSTELGGAGSGSAAGQLIEPGKPLQVGLVGYNASRFGRVELLEFDRDEARSDYCSSGRVHDSLRDSGRSRARRSGEMHRYPPFSQ
ncbi:MULTISPECIES: FAD-binding protein [unclassified Mycolicibacterium]|uniref:FAD-binding protein n=1 Tax=unclassified Mycolicibacterium TaxID=2636767 RepID=UPI0012DDB852|nr:MULTISPECIES: FAD-binding protein [unclassified Mycolicibacterium]MUL80797.1 FAD-binding protein [Mycolicibacterium sp. CBMA 329]MUL86564.1 FAD-binding protein [Mycolicibacterium sp. CBMA 331]MUM01425.1 FAD-binding protein [Mycolicibacterium sp. CBMA 334]MUM27230.1 FAD-binding protein [Mycolicibacterium sp. CBMA 295]MUM36860.1 FAD-binding protein [Mycolicibacterium sp. CBMA 247]